MEVEFIRKKMEVKKKEMLLDILDDVSLKFLQTEYFFLLVCVSRFTADRHNLLCVNEICFLAF